MSSSPKNVSTAPIFILGIGRRCGTNFLFQLLLLHPTCRAGEVVREDFFLTHADILQKYTETVYRAWDKSWRQQLDNPDALMKYIGDGLLSFLDAESLKDGKNSEVATRLVTKTPDVTNLPLFFQLFPNAKLLIMVRDGRAVVESSVKSFNRSYDEVMHEWADAARKIHQLATTEADHRYLIVRYEDLQQNTEAEMRKILPFLNLDSANYDFAAMHELPVFGSSQLVTEGKQKVHWEGNKFENFEPTKRWQHWDQTLHERFNWIAGQELQQLGYVLQPESGSPMPRVVRNTLQDGRWTIAKQLIPWQKQLWKRWAAAKKYVRKSA